MTSPILGTWVYPCKGKTDDTYCPRIDNGRKRIENSNRYDGRLFNGSDHAISGILCVKSIPFPLEKCLSRLSTMHESRTKSLPWNEETVYALGIYRLIGRTLGIWPLKCNDLRSKIRLVIIIVLLLIMNYNLIQEIVSGCISIINAVDFIGLLAANTVCILKVSVIRIHHKKLRCIVDSAVNDWSVICDDESREIMRKHAHRGRFVSMFQLSVAYLSAGFIIIGALPTLGRATNRSSEITNLSIQELRNLPMGTGCSVVDAPIYLYLAFYLFQLIQLLCVCICNFGTDSLFFGVAMHLCAQFELLKNDIARLDRHRCEIKTKQQFTTIIQRHNHLVRLVNLVEDVFHLIILGQLAASGLHISLLGIQMLFALRDHYYTTLLYTPTGITLLLLQLCMYSFVGDYLSSQAKGMRNAAYNCSWYNFSPSLAKDVMFVIMRSNDSFHLTAGKVFRMNIESFTSIVKTMASFFSVIKITVIG